MAERDAPSGSGDTGVSAFNVSRYINGWKIQWGKLFGTIAGASILAWIGGGIEVFLAIVDIPLQLLSWLAGFAGDVVTVVAGLPAVIIESGWAASVPFVVDAGIAAFLVAIALVLTTLYFMEWVISSVFE